MVCFDDYVIFICFALPCFLFWSEFQPFYLLGCYGLFLIVCFVLISGYFRFPFLCSALLYSTVLGCAYLALPCLGFCLALTSALVCLCFALLCLLGLAWPCLACLGLPCLCFALDCSSLLCSTLVCSGLLQVSSVLVYVGLVSLKLVRRVEGSKIKG